MRLGVLDKLQSFRMGSMEKQKSFRSRTMDKQQSFRERKNKESPGKRGDTELHLAARAGNAVHVQKILSECGEDSLKELVSKQNLDGETALYVAAEKGHVEVVHEILQVSDVQSAAVKANNSFDAFHIAAKQGHLGEPRKPLLVDSDRSRYRITNQSSKLYIIGCFLSFLRLLDLQKFQRSSCTRFRRWP